MKKTVITIAGIRPDFIRFKEIYAKLDQSPNINHILVHTGQHYDKMLSDVFFEELEIRKPDYNLSCGAPGKEHFQLSGDITVEIINLIRKENLNPDVIIFLGDTNSVVCSVGLKKEGYQLAHIEAGMRSYDRRMLEEINRVVCDHCCDMHFVYHKDYKQQLLREGIDKSVYVVGNTIVEVVKPISEKLFKTKKRCDQIIMDIHRPENFKFKDRMERIISYANMYIRRFQVPVKMIKFKRTLDYIEKYGLNLGGIQLVDLMSYKQFLEAQYHSLFVFSDSGTAQEEAALLNTPVIVPRDFTERPQSEYHNCSFRIKVGNEFSNQDSLEYLDKIIHGNLIIGTNWLGDGRTSEKIVSILESNLLE